MLSLTYRFCSPNSVHWPLEEANIGHQEDHNYISSGIFLELDNFTVPQTASSYNDQPPQNEAAKKKLNHNASERDRRKKINHLYSSLRSLLPASDHLKKLSIPATVSFALKYIPALQRQVEGLIRKRDELLSNINSRQQMNLQAKQKDHNNDVKCTIPTSIFSFSANQLNDTEFSVQISSKKGNKNTLSNALHSLEELGLSLLSASSFESVGGRVFHNLQFKVERSDGVDCRTIKDKLMSTYQNKEMLSHASIAPEKFYIEL